MERLDRSKKVRCTLKEAVDGNFEDAIVREIIEAVISDIEGEGEKLMGLEFFPEGEGVFMNGIKIASLSELEMPPEGWVSDHEPVTGYVFCQKCLFIYFSYLTECPKCGNPSQDV